MMQKLRSLLKEKGQGIIEYALLVGLVAAIGIGMYNAKIMNGIASAVSNVTSNVVSQTKVATLKS